ncbi:MAG: type III pantothenate kinase [Pyrinomonadaceae bacterium]
MLLAIDIGNSSIKFGIFDGDSLVDKFLIQTKRDYTVDELFFDRLRYIEDRFFTIDSVCVSSVVPELDDIVSQACRKMLRVTPVFVDPTFDFGIAINYEPVASAGTDRLINASAAVVKYGKPVIICSFGTATTIDTVNANGEYLGGAIAPGMNTLAAALHLKTSKLPHVAIEKPESVIGSTTVASIRSGVFFGYIGLVEGIIRRTFDELRVVPKVIATGGFSGTIAENSTMINVVDENLMLDGLRMLFEKHRP